MSGGRRQRIARRSICKRTSAPTLALLVAICGTLAPAGILLADETLPGADVLATAPPAKKSPWDLKLFRFEFDNDGFVGSDDAFTAGWSFQIHSRLMDEWDPAYAGWIGKFPGLGDDGQGGRVARWAYGLNQIIITPQDIGNPNPQPNDAPWAGYTGLTGTFYAYDNKRLGALQLYLGCQGPCSHAEQIQKFVHEDLGFGEPPKGWDNQLSNKVIANVNYEYRHKIYDVEEARYMPHRFAHDLSVGGQAAVGNLVTHLQALVEFRFGWGLAMGFTKIPDPAGLGMALDPVYLDPEKPIVDLKLWRKYFNLVARYSYIDYLAPAEGGATESGYDHPALHSYPGQREMLVGLHLVRVPWGVHITYYYYFDDLKTETHDSLDWLNFSFEYRF